VRYAAVLAVGLVLGIGVGWLAFGGGSAPKDRRYSAGAVADALLHHARMTGRSSTATRCRPRTSRSWSCVVLGAGPVRVSAYTVREDVGGALVFSRPRDRPL